MIEEKIIEVIEILSQIEGDSTVPRNVRIKIKSATHALNGGEQILAVKIDRSIQELDEVADDPNVPAYTKAQIWNVVSILESLQ